MSTGTPPLIHQANYDVPIPSVVLISANNTTEQRTRASKCFHELCKLIVNLGDILPAAFDLKDTRVRDSQQSFDALEVKVKDWNRQLPEWLTFNTSGVRRSALGPMSLQITYLATLLFLCRLDLHVRPELRSYHAHI